MNSYAELTRYELPCNRDVEEHRAMLAKLDRSPVRYWSNGRKFTDEQILEIRQRYATGTESHVRLGQEYGVSHSTISEIVNGRRYTNVGGDS